MSATITGSKERPIVLDCSSDIEDPPNLNIPPNTSTMSDPQSSVSMVAVESPPTPRPQAKIHPTSTSLVSDPEKAVEPGKDNAPTSAHQPPASSERSNSAARLKPQPTSSDHGKSLASTSNLISSTARKSNKEIPRQLSIHSLEDLSKYWTLKAEKSGAASITFENSIDDSLPFKHPNKFRYLERQYRSGPLLDVGITWKKCACFTGCSFQRDCRCQQREPYYTEEGYFRFLHTKDVIVECDESCKCPSSCRYRVSQRPRRIPIVVYKTENKGWCVRSPAPIKTGQIVGVYTGKLLKTKDALELPEAKQIYVFDISPENDQDEIWQDVEPMSVDASHQGNWTRFISHSCEPNLETLHIKSDIFSRVQPYIALVALEDIAPNCELTFDYNSDPDNPVIKECWCGMTSCRSPAKRLRPRAQQNAPGSPASSVADEGRLGMDGVVMSARKVVSSSAVKGKRKPSGNQKTSGVSGENEESVPLTQDPASPADSFLLKLDANAKAKAREELEFDFNFCPPLAGEDVGGIVVEDSFEDLDDLPVPPTPRERHRNSNHMPPTRQIDAESLTQSRDLKDSSEQPKSTAAKVEQFSRRKMIARKSRPLPWHSLDPVREQPNTTAVINPKPSPPVVRERTPNSVSPREQFKPTGMDVDPSPFRETKQLAIKSMHLSSWNSRFPFEALSPSSESVLYGGSGKDSEPAQRKDLPPDPQAPLPPFGNRPSSNNRKNGNSTMNGIRPKDSSSSRKRPVSPGIDDSLLERKKVRMEEHHDEHDEATPERINPLDGDELTDLALDARLAINKVDELRARQREIQLELNDALKRAEARLRALATKTRVDYNSPEFQQQVTKMRSFQRQSDNLL